MPPRSGGKPRNNARKEAARRLQRLNPGMSYKQAFRQAEPGNAPTAPRPPQLSVLLGLTSLPDIVSRYAEPTIDLTVPVGTSQTGETVKVNIETASQGRGGTGAHGIVSGITGSGATMVAMAIALALRAQNNQERLQVVLIDPDGRIHPGMSALADITIGADDAAATAWLTEQLSLRQAVLRSAEARDFHDLPLGALPRLIIVVADEPGRSVSFRRSRNPGSDAVRRIAMAGRQLGMNLLLLCAYSAPEDLRDVIGHLSYRVSLGQADNELTHFLLDDNDADLLADVRNARPGTAFLRTNYAQHVNGVTRFTAARVDEALAALVTTARTPQ